MCSYILGTIEATDATCSIFKQVASRVWSNCRVWVCLPELCSPSTIHACFLKYIWTYEVYVDSHAYWDHTNPDFTLLYIYSEALWIFNWVPAWLRSNPLFISLWHHRIAGLGSAFGCVFCSGSLKKEQENENGLVLEEEREKCSAVAVFVLSLLKECALFGLIITWSGNSVRLCNNRLLDFSDSFTANYTHAAECRNSIEFMYHLHMLSKCLVNHKFLKYFFIISL